MKRFLTTFCAIVFSGAALSAQNSADTIKGIQTFANPSIGVDIARFSLIVGYEYQLGFWGYFDGNHLHKAKSASGTSSEQRKQSNTLRRYDTDRKTISHRDSDRS